MNTGHVSQNSLGDVSLLEATLLLVAVLGQDCRELMAELMGQLQMKESLYVC